MKYNIKMIVKIEMTLTNIEGKDGKDTYNVKGDVT